MTAQAGTSDTFPKLLLEHARVRGASPAIREKDLGIWQAWTWLELREEVRALAGGLAAAGLHRDSHPAATGANRPPLYPPLTPPQSLAAPPLPFSEDAAAH